ncbi:hypothetical protein U1Q18_011486 [Sarracenia purpurea var. burkii]
MLLLHLSSGFLPWRLWLWLLICLFWVLVKGLLQFVVRWGVVLFLFFWWLVGFVGGCSLFLGLQGLYGWFFHLGVLGIGAGWGFMGGVCMLVGCCSGVYGRGLGFRVVAGLCAPCASVIAVGGLRTMVVELVLLLVRSCLPGKAVICPLATIAVDVVLLR